MVRNAETFRNQPKSLILEMIRTVGHRTKRDPKRSTPIDYSTCGVLSRTIRESWNPTVVGKVVPKHQEVLLTRIRRNNLDVFELKKAARRSTMTSGTVWTRYLFPSDCWKTVYARASEGVDVCRKSIPFEVLTEYVSSRRIGAMSAWASIRDDTESKLKVRLSVRYLNLPILVTETTVGVLAKLWRMVLKTRILWSGAVGQGGPENVLGGGRGKKRMGNKTLCNMWSDPLA